MSEQEDRVREAWESTIESKCPSRVTQNPEQYDRVEACCFPQGRFTDCCFENCPISIEVLLASERLSEEEIGDWAAEHFSHPAASNLRLGCHKGMSMMQSRILGGEGGE
jgi:hypothetical protein